eukprot:6213025-Pleurochrysis_carterae.AAC.7
MFVVYASVESSRSFCDRMGAEITDEGPRRERFLERSPVRRVEHSCGAQHCAFGGAQHGAELTRRRAAPRRVEGRAAIQSSPLNSGERGAPLDASFTPASYPALRWHGTALMLQFSPYNSDGYFDCEACAASRLPCASSSLQFKRGMYGFIFDRQGLCMAHGASKSFVGRRALPLRFRRVKSVLRFFLPPISAPQSAEQSTFLAHAHTCACPDVSAHASEFERLNARRLLHVRAPTCCSCSDARVRSSSYSQHTHGHPVFIQRSLAKLAHTRVPSDSSVCAGASLLA